MEPPAVGVAAYHAHQAAEKLLKGFLVVAAVDFRKTHDLDWLANAALPQYPDLQDALDVLRPLTSWGVAYRYPGPETEPEPLPPSADVGQVIDLLGELAARLRTLSAP